MVEFRLHGDEGHQDKNGKLRGISKKLSHSNEQQQALAGKDWRLHHFTARIREWWLRKTHRRLERPRISAPIAIHTNDPFADPLPVPFPEGNITRARKVQHEDIDCTAKIQAAYLSRDEVPQDAPYRNVGAWMLPERPPNPEPLWEESTDESGLTLSPVECERLKRDYGRLVLIRQFVERAVDQGVTCEEAEEFKRKMGLSPEEYEAMCRCYARKVRVKCFVETAAWHGVTLEYAELFERENQITVAERSQIQQDIARLIQERQHTQFEPTPHLPSTPIARQEEPIQGRRYNAFHARTDSGMGPMATQSPRDAPFSLAGPSNARRSEGIGHSEHHLPLRGGAGEVADAEGYMSEWPSNRCFISLFSGILLLWISCTFIVHWASDIVPQLAPDDAYLSYYDVRLTKEDVDSIKKGDWLTDNVSLYQLSAIHQI